MMTRDNNKKAPILAKEWALEYCAMLVFCVAWKITELFSKVKE
jgi:hypothetical protein